MKNLSSFPYSISLSQDGDMLRIRIARPAPPKQKGIVRTILGFIVLVR